MRTTKLVLLTFLSLLLASSCMPDSFTRFKEKKPSQTISSSGGSTSPTPTPTATVSDVVYSIDSLYIFQDSGDTIFFQVQDSTNFTVGDTINVAQDVLGISKTDGVGTLQGIYDNSGDSPTKSTVLVVKLDGSAVIGPNTYIASGNYVDNCVAGYGQCAAGSTGVGYVDSEVIFYIPTTTVALGSYNFNKAITIAGTSSAGYSTANLEFDYSFSSTVLGLGIDHQTSGIQTDDRIVSPYGPFLPNSTLDFVTSPLTITASIASGYRGTQLDSEETSTVDFYASTVVPGTKVQSTDAITVNYAFLDNQRIAIKVNNLSGFNVGDIILSCRVNSISTCTESSGYVVGKAQIQAINSGINVIYATAQGYNAGSNNSLFPNSNYIMNSAVTTVQSANAQAIFKTSDTGLTIAPIWKNNGTVTAAPAGATYSLSVETTMSGISINPTTGNITINTPQDTLENQLTVTATDSTTNAILSQFSFDINAIGAPTSIKVVDSKGIEYMANPGSPYNFKVAIDTTAQINLDVNAPLDFPTSDNFGLGYIYYSFSAVLPTGATLQNPNAVRSLGTLSFTPSTYVSGTTYTVTGYHPALTGTTSFDDLEITIKSASSFAALYYPQASGDKLILEVDDSTPFKIGDTISNDYSSQATINYINHDQNRLFVTLSATPSKASEQFLIDNNLDITATYVTSRATIKDVIYVFDVTNTTLSKAPAFFDKLGNAGSLQASETLSWAITPALPSDLTLNASGNLTVNGSPTSLSVMSETLFTIQGTNNIGEILQTKYRMAVVKSPSNASVARYQIIKLSANGNKFYRGSRIASPDDNDPATIDPTGRVLMTLDTDGDSITDSLLIEGNGVFKDGMGIDNTASYFASEATVVPHAFIYVKDPTQVSVSDTITGTISGATGKVIDKNNASNVLYVKVTSGTFQGGEAIDSNSGTTSIDNIETNHFITHVLEMSATSNFDVGEKITGATANDVGIVVAVYNPYIFVRQVKPSSSATDGKFSQGDTITDANSTTRTINSIVGPNITIGVVGGTGGAQNTSGTTANTNESFYEGQPITCYASAGTYMSSGFAVAGTDFLTSKNIVMQVEDFDSHCYQGTNNFIDDVSAGTVAGNTAGADGNDISTISTANLMIGYVGDGFFLDSFVQGQISSASIAPDVLPSGLTFDSTTGEISGVPTVAAASQSYTVTFYSSDGQNISYTFDLVIYNQFEVSQATNTASSFHMHKEGQGYGASYCRIITPQVIDDNGDARYNKYIYGFNDVLCRLEGGEGDLADNGISYEVTAGAGMCEYVEYIPYSYKPFLPGKTDRYAVIYNDFADATACGTQVGGGTATSSGNAFTAKWGPSQNLALVDWATLSGGTHLPQTAANLGNGATTDPDFNSTKTICIGGDCIKATETSDVCRFDYSKSDNSWPNLDNGTISIATVDCTYSESLDDPSPGDTSSDCACNVTFSEVRCGGDPDQNMGGAKTSWDSGYATAGVVYNSNSGLNQSIVVKGTISEKVNNSYLANFLSIDKWTTAGQCYSNTYHVNGYTSIGTLTDNAGSWNSYVEAYDPLGSSGGSSNSLDYSNFYTFSCLDAAYNVKARVRVQVRDWDREFTPELADLEKVTSGSTMNDSNYDQIWDLDGFFFGKSANLPQYNSCGSAARSTYTLTPTATVTAGDFGVTLSSGIPAGEEFPAGTVLLLTFSDGSKVPFMSKSTTSIGTTSFNVSNIGHISESGVTVEVVRKVPYPRQ